MVGMLDFLDALQCPGIELLGQSSLSLLDRTSGLPLLSGEI